MNDLLNRFKKLLEDISLEEYSSEKLPCHYDEKILSFVNAMAGSDFNVQGSFQSLLSTGDASKLRIFSENVASLAIRKSSIEIVKSGLYALSYCFKIEDWRDILVRICLLYHSILRLKYSPYNVLNEMRLYDLNFKKFLEDFFERDEEDKSLKAFRYIESEEKGGFVYKSVYNRGQ